MIFKKQFRLLFSHLLILALLATSLLPAGYAQTAPAAASVASDELNVRLARIERRVEARRAELRIPGMSLAIVKDGQVVLSKGFGYKNFERKIPATADTQFAIGSASTGTTYAATPYKTSTEMSLTALGKEIGTVIDYFDGTNGGQATSFSRDETYTGQRLEDVKFAADFYSVLSWKADTRSVEIQGIEKVGGEETYIVRVKPEKANALKYNISVKTFLPVRTVSVVVSSTSPQKLPIVQTMSDYREVDGVMLPFTTVTANPGMGDVVVTAKQVSHNTAIDESKFRARE